MTAGAAWSPAPAPRILGAQLRERLLHARVARQAKNRGTLARRRLAA